MTNKIGLTLILALFSFGVVFSFKPSPELFSEMGPFELAQALLMVASLIIWWRLAIVRKRETSRDDNIHYTIAIFFAVLSFVVVGRETSFLKVYGAGENLELGLMLLTTVIAVSILGVLSLQWFRTPRNTWRIFRAFISTPNFFWAISSFVFILMGDFFEKEWLPIQFNIVWEETFELMGYFAIVVAALVSERSIVPHEVYEQEIAINKALS
ncbi:hypothetical protein [Pseudovibrio sp. Ad26]|uniref:hypothetical protein n=1 Tax=Pseudovibrio sp. Ad26 TaxID=989410 RepID=UPI0007B29A69|nr:hypothetical protein [Pseudovibrio sp. Ad26]KZL16973.1 hypothetical protein PsAD26_00131 [Pseudovibrio sp. Ad26]